MTPTNTKGATTAAAGPLPALAAGLVVIEGDDDLLVEGGAVRRVFTGRAARDLLPRLLPLLDGSTTAARAAELLGVPETHVVQALAAVDRAGLLSGGVPDSLPPGDPAAAFLSRALPVTGRRGIGGRRPALAAAVVAVHADAPLRDPLAADLRGAGVARVVESGGAEPLADADGPDLAIVQDDGGPRLADACAAYGARGVPVLRIGGAGDRPQVGPLLLPGVTACPACVLRASADAPSAPLSSDGALLACGFAAAEALALLTGHTPPLTGHRVLRPGSEDAVEDRRTLVPDDACATCGVGGDTAEGLLLARLEWLGRDVPWAVAPVPDRGPRRQFDLVTSPRIALSEAPLPPGLAATIAACASGHAVDAYVLGARALPHPLYRYDPADEALIATRGDLDAPILPDGLPPGPDAVLVVVAAPGRLTPDHGAGGLRRAYLRAGRAVASTVAAADAAGLSLTVAPGVDARLPGLLELYETREQIAAVIGVHGERP
ncbi:hypothetical protein AB0I72_01645 [Nocardiopsis sp. NPDC049922]|uniref:hypothetical protein n=1 Tax=Nocardiopsis sp. NPDC049922 TaxID=3155157 RepID=UPI0033C6B4D9